MGQFEQTALSDVRRLSEFDPGAELFGSIVVFDN